MDHSFGRGNEAARTVVTVCLQNRPGVRLNLGFIGRMFQRGLGIAEKVR